MKSRRIALLAILVCGVSIWSGCSSNSPGESAAAEAAAAAPDVAKAEAPPQPSLFTARDCFTRLQSMAMRWSNDARPFLMESRVDPEALGRDGKAPQWSAMFASPSRNATRTFTCSKNGIDSGLETPYSSAITPFDAFLFKTNSDEAFKVAQEHGGDGVIKRDAKVPVTYALQVSRGQNVPYWFVIYGTAMQNNKGMGVINAATGAFVRATSATK